MKRIYFLILFLPFFLNNCIQTPDPKFPKQINYLFSVTNVGDTLNVGDDSVIVREIKLLADKFNLVLHNGGLLQSQPDALVMEYTARNTDDVLVVSTSIGYEDIDRFKEMELFISPAEDGDEIRDRDFFGRSTNYSFIIKGIYNNDSFVYKSNVSFEKNFQFNVIKLTELKETLTLRILLNIEDILIDSKNRIIDPANQNNKEVIDSLMKATIALEAFPSNRLF
ncbi:MAG TPA: hypothetical protein VF181_09180 [Balneolaceae bacterium]